MSGLNLKMSRFGGEKLTRMQLKGIRGGVSGVCPCKNECNTNDDCPGNSDCEGPQATCMGSSPSCTYKTCSGKI
jgi:hypothetical protein